MLAMLGILGTRYACHDDKKLDQTCFSYQFWLGPGMFQSNSTGNDRVLQEIDFKF